MSLAPTPRRRWRRTALAAAGVSLVATISPLISANPAAAINAPLETTDGVGLRLDENAILGPALEAIETEMQVYADGLIQSGAEANSVMDDPDWVWTDSNLELSFDFINAGTPGYTQGGLAVHADLQDIRMQFYRYGEWWQPECLIEVNPNDATIDVSAYIDTSKLPAAPLTLNPVDATWDEDPDVTIVDGPWTCNGYLIDEWWEGLWGSGTDIAEGIENDMDAEAQELIDGLWAEHVTPVIDSLTAFGVTFNQVRTDDHGLIVTADVDATGGLTIPGMTGGPYDVTNTPDAGVTTNVNTLLANRGEVIATVHPNVASQFLNAMNQALSSQYGQYATASSIESVLLPPAVHGLYPDASWVMRLTATSVPFVAPTGSGGLPQMQMNVQLRFINSAKGLVATFTGTLSGLDLLTEVQTNGTWGPSFSSTNAALTNLTRTQANVDAATIPAQSASAILPYVKTGFDHANDDLFVAFIELPPLSIGGLSISLCTACGRYSGDQRYTETFNVA